MQAKTHHPSGSAGRAGDPVAAGPDPAGFRYPEPLGPGDAEAVDIAWLLKTPLVGVTRWRCRERGAGVTSEKRQLWRVIGFVHEGAYGVRNRRGGGLVDAMHVALFQPGEPYTTSHPCGTGDHGSALVLEERLFCELLERRHPRAAADGRRLPAAAPCPTVALRRQMDLLGAAESPGGAEPLAAEEAAVAIAGAILGAAAGAGDRDSADVPSACHRALAEETRAFLGREFRRPLLLAEIAGAVDSTPAHLCRVFRRATGAPIHRYLTGLRLRAAIEPLRSGTDDLSGLALDLGFSSHSHFTFAFRREFGRPPSRWRAVTPRRLPPRGR